MLKLSNNLISSLATPRTKCSTNFTFRCYTTQKTQLRVLKTHSTDPFFNLATEDWLFREGDTSKETLFLWRNEPTVVVGRNQNPWKECYLHQMALDGIHLARRMSGGGAVYHDLGNTCFTFMSPKSTYSKVKNTNIVCDALRHQFGVHAEQNDRNDILVNGKKISGSAYKLSGNKALHHGTLLISANLHNLNKYLYVNKEKMQSKGVDSIRSHVTNLSTLNPKIHHDTVSNAIIKEFFRHYDNSCEVEVLDMSELEKIPHLKKTYEELKDWKWRFGETPSFDYHLDKKFDWGVVDLKLSSKDGLITGITLISESLDAHVIEAVSTYLHGKKYDKMGFIEGLDHARKFLEQQHEASSASKLLDIEQWLLQSL